MNAEGAKDAKTPGITSCRVSGQTCDTSRNTFQNVVAASELMRQRDVDRVVVVTDATHLLRSVLRFEAQGFPVDASGCRHRATRFVWSILAFVPSAHDAADAAHEWLGLAWYWMRG